MAVDYGALEPSISGKIMELHHDKHHATYVNSLNTQSEKMQEAQSKGDVAAQIAIQPLINFHGGACCLILLCIANGRRHEHVKMQWLTSSNV